ncbi:hypothetical protein Taro_018264 [Colocasia esculenta]|uniref:Uncharacterized protein n=1 Tax=Colocasia esculenta TaxID=4460 RepID=A0A843UTD3_COLES|nr:hypothetical protein [Colocasia esculenta]
MACQVASMLYAPDTRQGRSDRKDSSQNSQNWSRIASRCRDRNVTPTPVATRMRWLGVPRPKACRDRLLGCDNVAAKGSAATKRTGLSAREGRDVAWSGGDTVSWLVCMFFAKGEDRGLGFLFVKATEHPVTFRTQQADPSRSACERDISGCHVLKATLPHVVTSAERSLLREYFGLRVCLSWQPSRWTLELRGKWWTRVEAAGRAPGGGDGAVGEDPIDNSGSPFLVYVNLGHFRVSRSVGGDRENRVLGVGRGSVGPFVCDCETERLWFDPLCCLVGGTVVLRLCGGVEVELCSVEVVCQSYYLVHGFRHIEVRGIMDQVLGSSPVTYVFEVRL